MLIAITTEGKIGLGVAAGIFIVFALVVSFWFPRRNPDFPGDRLGAFVSVAVLLFVATVAAVVVFAKEEEGAHAAETHAETQPPAATGGGETEPEGETETVAGGGGGDPEAGAELFAANGCGGCHTLEAAGASGNVGPDLDETELEPAEAAEVIANGRGAMPAFGDQLDDQQIADLAAYVTD